MIAACQYLARAGVRSQVLTPFLGENRPHTVQQLKIAYDSRDNEWFDVEVLSRPAPFAWTKHELRPNSAVLLD